MKQSFKQFSKFVDASDDELANLSEEQLNEIFGIFRNNAKIDAAKAQREKLKKAEQDKKAELDKARTLAWQKAKERVERENGGFNPKERGTGTIRSQAAMGRSAELDWVRSAASESARHIVDALVEGSIAVHQVYHEPIGQDEREVSLLLREAVKRFKLLSEDNLIS